MRITGLKSTVVAVPSRGSTSSETHPGHYTLAVLVEVLTDEGLIGIGEAPCVLGAQPTKAIIDAAEPVIVGEDPTNVEMLKKKLYGVFNLTHLHIHSGCWALNAIDMALWDLVGKSCGKPLYQLWGGAFRKKIEYYGSIDRSHPEDVAEQTAQLVKEGFRTLYMKVGFDEDEDLACIKAIREASSPKHKIRVDANQSWSPGEAIRIIRRMSEYGLEFVDQPVLMYNVDALARVRASVNVPIASHESSWTMYDALNVIKREAADVIHIDPRFDAGMTGARLTAGMAEAAGLPVLTHSFGELGVAQAAYMHLIASGPNFILANQTGYRGLADDVIKGGPLQFHDGCMDLPEKPGIGVELDPQKVAQYARYYDEKIKGTEFTQPWQTTKYALMQYRRFFGY